MDTPIDPHHPTIMKTGTNVVDADHNHIIKDTTAKVTINPTEVILGNNIGTADNITGVIHNALIQTLTSTILTMILYIEGHLYTEAHQLTHKITADQSLNQPTGQLSKPHIRIHHIPENLKEIQESQ